MSKPVGELWQTADGTYLLVGVADSDRRRIYLDEKGRIKWRAKIVTGLKRMSVTVGGKEVKTPYGEKECLRRIAANKVAKQARKRNR